MQLKDLKKTFRVSKSFFNKIYCPGITTKLSIEFYKLIATQSENNQNKAENILKKVPNLAAKIISKKMINLKDSTGRIFITPMSSYGYAFWVGDTSMCLMMDQYLDDSTKYAIYDECKAISLTGISFCFNGNGTNHSISFDFQPLIAAYRIYIMEAAKLLNAKNFQEKAWADVDKLWLNIGKEQAKVPLYVAQEYCSNQSFYNRSAKFLNWTGREQYWFTSDGAHSNLGQLFTIVKHSQRQARQGNWSPYGGSEKWLNYGRAKVETSIYESDLQLIINLSQTRLITDRIEILNNLHTNAAELSRST